MNPELFDALEYGSELRDERPIFNAIRKCFGTLQESTLIIHLPIKPEDAIDHLGMVTAAQYNYNEILPLFMSSAEMAQWHNLVQKGMDAYEQERNQATSPTKQKLGRLVSRWDDI
jgi:hypothetical protein